MQINSEYIEEQLGEAVRFRAEKALRLTWKLNAQERERAHALRHYHTVQKFKPRLHERRQSLEAAYRRHFNGDPATLEKAFRRALVRKPRITKSREEQRILKTLRRRFEKAVKAKIVSPVILELTGTTLEGLRKHLESKFDAKMSWKNYGFFGWHIDHIRPCASFDLMDPAQRAQCFHYSNLQPLWWDKNLSKGARV